MEETDSPGRWTLSVSQDPRPFALFVRDAVRLDVRGEPTAPPPLDPPAPDHRDLLSLGERDRVAEQWPAWWRAVLAHEAQWHGARVTGDVLRWLRAQAGVAGPWRRVVAPGVLVCSVVDLETEADAVVREVLESSVSRP